MSVYVGESTLIFTGGTIATGGASAGDLAAEISAREAGDNALAENVGKIFPTRNAAVSAGQAALPPSYRVIVTIEGNELVFRRPGNAGSTNDPLFPGSYPSWPEYLRAPTTAYVDNRRVGYTNDDNMAGSFIPDSINTLVQRNAGGVSIRERLTEAPDPVDPDIHRQDAQGNWWIIRWSSATDRADWTAADTALASNIGKIFPTRNAAVSAGQQALPPSYGVIVTLEGTDIVFRRPGTASDTADPLFPGSYPAWIEYLRISDSDSSIADEIAARIAGDEQLQDNIDAEEAARISAFNSQQASILALGDRQDGEEAARIAGDQNLQNQIDNIAISGTRVVGDWDASIGAFPTSRPDSSPILAGDQWNVTGSGTVDGIDFAPGDVLIALVDGGGTTYENNWSKRSGTATTASQVSTDAAGISVQTVIDRSDAVFPTVADAIGQRITGEIVTIRGEESSQYVKVPAEPVHTEKFADIDGNWWSKQNTHNVSIREFGTYEGETVDAQPFIQRALDFLLQSQDNRGQILDLGGLTFGVASGIELPRFVKIRNGLIKALGDGAAWGSNYIVQGKGGHGNWSIDAVDLDCNSAANGVRVNSSANIEHCNVKAYKDFGLHYAGGGCKIVLSGANKQNSNNPELSTNKDFMSSGYGLYSDSADGKFVNVVVRGKMGTSSGVNHNLFTNIHVYNGTGVSETVLGSELVSGSYVAPWTLSTVDDVFVRKNGVMQVQGTDYTIVLDSMGFPTFTFVGAVDADTFFIKVRFKDMTTWEIRGGNCDFQGCYFDNGYVDVYKHNNRFSGVQLYNSQNVLLDAQVRLWATRVDQQLEDFEWNVLPNNNLPTFKLMAENGANWVAGSEVIEGYKTARFSTSGMLNVRGSNNAEVEKFASSNTFGRALIGFKAPSTVDNIWTGVDGNTFVVRFNNGNVIITDAAGVSHFTGGVKAGGFNDLAINAAGLHNLRPYTVAGLPTPANHTGCLARVTDPATGKVPVVFSDGSAWYYMDGTTVA